MAVNKVVYNSASGTKTLIDLTADTIVPAQLGKGITAHNAKGELITGVMDVRGHIGANNVIYLYGDLPEGTYHPVYENEDGATVELSDMVLVAKPKYVNQIPISITSSKTLFVGTNGEKGYKTGYRLSLSGGGESAQTGTEVTGFIKVTRNSVIRIKNIAYDGDTTRGVVGYDANFNKLSTGNGAGLNSMFATNGYDDGNGVRRTPPLTQFTHFASDSLAYIRLCSTDINENSILTVDEEIV